MNRIVAAGLVVTVLLVLVLIGSMVRGLGAGGEPLPEVGAEGARGGARVRVEVLNAAGVPDLARSATDRLRARGFDVVFYGNAVGFSPDSSQVLARNADPETANRVADAAGIALVRVLPDSTRYVDVTVIIGRDWDGVPTDSTLDSDTAVLRR